MTSYPYSRQVTLWTPKQFISKPQQPRRPEEPQPKPIPEINTYLISDFSFIMGSE